MSAAAAGPAEAGPVTVLFLGNPLLGDDGLGERALEALQRDWVLPPGLELVAGGNGGLDLLPVVEDARRLIVVDAIEAEAVPGTVVALEDDAIPTALGAAISPHQVGIAQVLALARIRGDRPERVLALGLQPGSLREGIGLSREVEAGLDALVERLVAELGAWGLVLRSRRRRPA